MSLNVDPTNLQITAVAGTLPGMKETTIIYGTGTFIARGAFWGIEKAKPPGISACRGEHALRGSVRSVMPRTTNTPCRLLYPKDPRLFVKTY